MTNVISLPRRKPTRTKATRSAALARCFARERRGPDDVFWLKENAEFLNIAECTGLERDDTLLEPYQEFYQQAAERIEFFPQYYRFLTSITLDLEDMGMRGDMGALLCAYVRSTGRVEAELSDLQRAEAHRLLARRDEAVPDLDALTERLHRFISQPASFALPNRKAAYELTHIIFYLSEYGRHDPQIDERAVKSLHFAGIIAYIEQNADLLAEICVALRYAGMAPPKIWETWITQVVRGFEISARPTASQHDNYHEYFVANWACAAQGGDSFSGEYNGLEQGFHNRTVPLGALHSLSGALLDQGPRRSSDWEQMKNPLLNTTAPDIAEFIQGAAGSTPLFAEFFGYFARAPQRVGGIGSTRHAGKS